MLLPRGVRPHAVDLYPRRRAGTTENYGENGNWQRPRAKEQLQVAEDAFAQKIMPPRCTRPTAILRVWPLSDYAAGGISGRPVNWGEERRDEAAFNAYQTIVQKKKNIPKSF